MITAHVYVEWQEGSGSYTRSMTFFNQTISKEARLNDSLKREIAESLLRSKGISYSRITSVHING